MKRILYTLAALAALCGCEKVQESAPVEPAARLVTLPTVPWSGSDGFLVNITATVPVTAEISADASWLTYYGMEMTSRSGGAYALVFSAAENPAKQERSAGIRICADADGTLLLSFDLVQEAAEDPAATVRTPDPVPYTGGEVVLPVTANVPFEAACGAEWITLLTQSESAVTLILAENPDPEPRTGTVVLTWPQDGRELASVEITQQGRPSEGIRLERVWGRYATADEAWYNTLGMTPGANQDRFIAMDDRYIYTSIIVNNNASYGIVVLDRATGAYVKTLTDGIEKAGLWAVSALQVMDNGGKSVLVACNMARKQEQHQLRIYAWEDIDQAPQVVSWSFADTHSDSRFGDKIGVSGDWQDGEIYLCDYFAGDPRPLLIFPVREGKIATTPVDTDLGGIVSGASNMATLYPLDGGAYLYYGSSGSTEFYNATLTRSGNMFSGPVTRLLPSRGFDAIMNGVQVLDEGGSRYLIWLSMAQAGLDHTAFLKTLPLPGADSAAGLKALADNGMDSNVLNIYPIAHATDLGARGFADSSGKVNGNCTGDTALRKIDGTWYVAALGTSSGISLFKVVPL